MLDVVICRRLDQIWIGTFKLRVNLSHCEKPHKQSRGQAEAIKDTTLGLISINYF
jgi:hypothetical protein